MAGTAALDQLKAGIHFIGTIDGQIDAFHRIQAQQRNAQLSCQHLPLKRGRDADDVLEFAAGQLGAQRLDHQSCCGSGTQTEHHAVPDLLNGSVGHRLLHLGLKIRHRAEK